MSGRQADLVVVGYGAAGAAAAITAVDLGADVVVLEKQPREGHTPSTRMSGGILMACGGGCPTRSPAGPSTSGSPPRRSSCAATQTAG